MRLYSFLLLSITTATMASQPLTWDRLLSSTTTEPAIQAADKKISLLHKGTAPQYWDDLEFRYQADGLGMLEHDFELRLKPKTLGTTAASKTYWESQASYQVAKRKAELSEINYFRYYSAVRYLAVTSRLTIHEQLAAVNQDRIQVLLSMSGSELFSPYDLIDAQSLDADLQANILEDHDLLHDLTMGMRSWVPDFDTVSLDTAWLPSVEDIQSQLENHPPQVDTAYPELTKSFQKLLTTQTRLDLEKVSDNSIIKSIGLAYTWTIAKKEYDYFGNTLTDVLRRREDNSRAIDRWSLSVNLRVPFFDGKDDQLSRQVDLLDRESDYLAEKRSLEQKVSRVREEITALLKQRAVQQKFIQQVDAGSLFQDFAERAGSNPLLLLKARESGLQSALRSTRLEYEIYYRYLALLQYSGVLAQENTANHLKAGIQK